MPSAYIVDEVGGYKVPLRDVVCLEVIRKVVNYGTKAAVSDLRAKRLRRGERRAIRTIPDAKRTGGHVCDGVEDDEAVVLAHVVGILSLVR